MGRIADAYARAGRKLDVEDSERWEADRETAERHLGQLPTPNSQLPNVPASDSQLPNVPASAPLEVGSWRLGVQPVDFELASAIRRIFLSPKSAVRSVLFCAAPGERMTDVAWQAAEVLAAQSGQPVAFVEDPNNRAPNQSFGHALITRIDWCPVDDAVKPAPTARASSLLGDVTPSSKRQARKTNDVLGEQIAELHPRFTYVIVNVSAPMHELAPLARQVDGVLVVIAEGRTQADAAKTLVDALRADARIIGAILTT
jgi:hypothetical protein